MHSYCTYVRYVTYRYYEYSTLKWLSRHVTGFACLTIRCHARSLQALGLLELGGREEPLSISLGKKHSVYTRIQPLFSSLFSLYSAARRVLPEIGPWQCCNPNMDDSSTACSTMEALAIAASAISFVGAAEKAGKHLKRIKRLLSARDDVEALLQEVSEFESVAKGINNSFASLPEEQLSDRERVVNDLLLRAGENLLELDRPLHYDFVDKRDESGKLHVDRTAWARKKDDAIRIHERSKSIRLSLMVSLTTMNA